MDVRHVFTVLRRRKWIIVLVTLATVGAAAYLAHTHQPRYRANAVIRLVDTRRVLAGGLVDPKSTEVMERTADPLRSQIQVLLSRAVAGEVVDSSDPLGLRVRARGFPDSLLRNVSIAPDSAADSLLLSFSPRDVSARAWKSPRGWSAPQQAPYGSPIEIDGVGFTMTKIPGVPQGTLIVVPRQAAINELLNNLTAEPRVDTDVIDVEYTANDARLAQRIANLVVEVFQGSSAQTAYQQARRRRSFVEEQLRQNDSLLADSERSLSRIQSVRERANRGTEISAGEQAALTALEARREELDADRRIYQTLLSGLQRPRSGQNSDALRALVSFPGSAANPIVSQLYAQLVAFQTTRDSLTTGPWRSATTHPDVTRLDALIAATETDLVSAIRSYYVLARCEDRGDRQRQGAQPPPQAVRTGGRGSATDAAGGGAPEIGGSAPGGIAGGADRGRR